MFYVEIYRKSDGNVEKRMGPMTERKAGRVENGLLINLNWEEYATRVVSA